MRARALEVGFPAEAPAILRDELMRAVVIIGQQAAVYINRLRAAVEAEHDSTLAHPRLAVPVDHRAATKVLSVPHPVSWPDVPAGRVSREFTTMAVSVFIVRSQSGLYGSPKVIQVSGQCRAPPTTPQLPRRRRASGLSGRP